MGRLVQAVRHAAELDVLRRPLVLTDPKRCAEEAEAGVRFTCFSTPTLWEKRRCYVDLPVEGCGSLPMFELTGVQWRVIEKGRDKMCKAVDKHLKRADARSRAHCLSQCAQEVRVRCPAP